ncbi:hypothetical protein [Myxococcus xanthus]|uniref:hypothetical protein n=1 Tax=Myxococcus xanthus TaxID=34 RepID=UPI00148DD3A3|nr:hypothetical protein [Myxococcus xanthus]NOJ86955.1 hypothetical protein [Myxococcus xanthus]
MTTKEQATDALVSVALRKALSGARVKAKLSGTTQCWPLNALKKPMSLKRRNANEAR